MWPYIIVGIAILAAMIVLLVPRHKHSVSKSSAIVDTQHKSDSTILDNDDIALAKYNEMTIKFEDRPALTIDEETRLVEVKDQKLLARIDSVIPSTIQAVANSGAAKGAQEIAKEAGKLYKVIIPRGAVLDKSRSMEGAVRASYRKVANSIKGNANLLPFDAKGAKGLAAVNVANAAMNVASMVVGQYYMSQIYDKLGDITDDFAKIADFQNIEYKGKVYALIAEVQKASTFQLETMENNELRNRELLHLKNLEHECAELLGQANLTIQRYAEKKVLDYDKYEKLVGEAQLWLQYQQTLLGVMRQIADLSYALNLGAISRENSFALLAPYAKQATAAQGNLIAWHEENCKRLKIDVDAAWRKRQGIDKIFMAVPALFNDDLHYKALPKNTVRLIREQTSGHPPVGISNDDHFYEDVQLIAKDGKLYYLPIKSE